MRKKKKNRNSNFQKNMGLMTNKRIGAMRNIDEENGILFLYEPHTRLYVVFAKKYLSSFYAKNYKVAEHHFNHLVAQS